MTILCYRLLLLKGLLALVPLTLLCIFVVDEPLARLVHEHGAPIWPFFAALMVATDHLSWLFHAPSPLGVPWAWSLLLLLFLVGRMRRWPHCTIWLVVLLTMVGSEGIGNLL